MDARLIYSIGEALAVEVEEIKDVTYPKGCENPQEIYITTRDDKRYIVSLKEL